jgi:beta-phosphoglucomutase family hydrolase
MSEFAAIFDWDGVVIDSSTQHERSWELLSGETGKPLPTGHFKRGFGKKNEVIISEILSWSLAPEEILRLGDRKEELYRELVRRGGITVLPGARELLVALKSRGIPRALGSSTPRANLDAILGVTGLDDFFDAIVSAEDVVNGKPAPDVFLKAALLLGIPAQRCVVFEDALFGVEAARRAGMKVVAVATTNPIDLLGDADRAVQSLEEISVEDVRALALSQDLTRENRENAADP